MSWLSPAAAGPGGAAAGPVVERSRTRGCRGCDQAVEDGSVGVQARGVGPATRSGRTTRDQATDRRVGVEAQFGDEVDVVLSAVVVVAGHRARLAVAHGPGTRADVSQMVGTRLPRDPALDLVGRRAAGAEQEVPSATWASRAGGTGRRRSEVVHGGRRVSAASTPHEGQQLHRPRRAAPAM